MCRFHYVEIKRKSRKQQKAKLKQQELLEDGFHVTISVDWALARIAG